VSRARAPAALLTGAAGQLGRALQATAPETWRVIACDAAALDVTRPEAVEEVVRRERPALIVNAGAYTAVDAAEREAERAEAFTAVARAPLRNLAEHNPSALADALGEAFPWLEYLPAGDRRQFVDEFTRVATAAAAVDNLTPLAQLIRE